MDVGNVLVVMKQERKLGDLWELDCLLPGVTWPLRTELLLYLYTSDVCYYSTALSLTNQGL